MVCCSFPLQRDHGGLYFGKGHSITAVVKLARALAPVARLMPVLWPARCLWVKARPRVQQRDHDAAVISSDRHD